MKVLVVHNRYRSDVPSGENRVVDAEIEMLTAAGVEVVPYLRSSDEIDGLSAAKRLTLPLQPIHGREAIADIERLITNHRPDILHLHNPYPLVSLSVVGAAHRLGVPVVQTVHNHRHSCMRGSYFRDGHDCRLCQGRATPWPAVQHGCYRDSRLQSAPMAIAFRIHRGDQRAVDRYIALTQPIAESLLQSGLVRPEQVVVRPNTVPDPGPWSSPGIGALFVGRLTAEKGVDILLDAWLHSERALSTLTVVGDGPLRPLVERVASRPDSGVVVRGSVPTAEVGREMRACAAVVLPSRSPEALPLVLLEAFAHGRPVLATKGGGLDATVDVQVGSLVAASAAGLADGLRALAGANLEELGRAARSRFETRYSPDVVIAAQIGIYQSLMTQPE